MAGNTLFRSIGKGAADAPPIKEVDSTMDNFTSADVRLPKRSTNKEFGTKFGFER